LESNTKFAVIAAVMSIPALEVVDHVAGIQFGFTAHPTVFVGCVPPRTSTLFCAARGVTPSSDTAPNKNNIRSFFIASLSLPLRPVRVWRESKTRQQGGPPNVLPTVEKVSQGRAIVSLPNAVFCLTVLPYSEKSVEHCFRHTDVKKVVCGAC
jgi:hypothetical protein